MARVLVVEDNADLSELFTFILGTAGHYCRAAFDGVEGLEAIRRESPDLIILDIEMPRMAGPEMVQQMRIHNHGEETISILLVSARPDLADLGRKLKLPFLAKPFDVACFLETVAAFAA